MTDEELIDLCALRYAVGRRTYITSIVSNNLIMRLKQYSSQMLKLIKEEIERAPSLGDPCDETNWKYLLEETEHELNVRHIEPLLTEDDGD